MQSHIIFIESNILEIKRYVQKIIEFCSSICTEITFETLLDNYNLSMEEYKKACNDFFNYYQDEDKKRRNEFVLNPDYRRLLLNTNQTLKEVSDYFDRLHQYDLIQFTELKNNLKQYISSTKNKISLTKKQDMSIHTKKELFLPKEAYQGNQYTFNSHCTIGGLYKVFRFSLIRSVVNHMMNEADLFKYYIFDDTNKLEDPAFYSNNNLLLSVCTHERTSTLYLSEEQYETFRKLDIPYRL